MNIKTIQHPSVTAVVQTRNKEKTTVSWSAFGFHATQTTKSDNSVVKCRETPAFTSSLCLRTRVNRRKL